MSGDAKPEKSRPRDRASELGLMLMTVAGLAAFTLVQIEKSESASYLLPAGSDVWIVGGYFFLIAVFELSPWAPAIGSAAAKGPVALRIGYFASVLMMLVSLVYTPGHIRWVLLLPWFLAYVCRLVLAMRGVRLWGPRR